jgi:hypothetical protein
MQSRHPFTPINNAARYEERSEENYGESYVQNNLEKMNDLEHQINLRDSMGSTGLP